MKKILFISSSRADYGLLRQLILETQKMNKQTYLMAKKAWAESVQIAFAGHNLSLIGMRSIVMVLLIRSVKIFLKPVARLKSLMSN